VYDMICGCVCASVYVRLCMSSSIMWVGRYFVHGLCVCVCGCVRGTQGGYGEDGKKERKVE